MCILHNNNNNSNTCTAETPLPICIIILNSNLCVPKSRRAVAMTTTPPPTLSINNYFLSRFDVIILLVSTVAVPAYTCDWQTFDDVCRWHRWFALSLKFRVIIVSVWLLKVTRGLYRHGTLQDDFKGHNNDIETFQFYIRRRRRGNLTITFFPSWLTILNYEFYFLILFIYLLEKYTLWLRYTHFDRFGAIDDWVNTVLPYIFIIFLLMRSELIFIT